MLLVIALTESWKLFLLSVHPYYIIVSYYFHDCQCWASTLFVLLVCFRRYLGVFYMSACAVGVQECTYAFIKWQ